MGIGTGPREDGADEFWLCDLEGRLFVYLADSPDEATGSALCPSCPGKLDQ
jgi:hypothetical protein